MDTTTSGGWTCSVCNQWVPNGEPHVCYATTKYKNAMWPTTFLSSYHEPDYNIALERIAVALEGILEELKRS